MKLEQYEYLTNSGYLEYHFFSEGPKGGIKKIARFNIFFSKSNQYYNLGFGDWNEQAKEVDDLVISNNKDAEKVLATVASIVIHFTSHFPGALIYAEGTTLSRTRRYQMGLNKYWNQIDDIFEVYGFVEGAGWELFEKCKNYLAFLIKRKKA